jgi:hypothetical protein
MEKTAETGRCSKVHAMRMPGTPQYSVAQKLRGKCNSCGSENLGQFKIWKLPGGFQVEAYMESFAKIVSPVCINFLPDIHKYFEEAASQQCDGIKFMQGGPGCGKSYYIRNYIKKHLQSG